VAKVAAGSEEANRIDAALEKWRQGDLALDQTWFVHMGDPSSALTEAADQATGEEGVNALTSEVRGLVVITQTCDIVRECMMRPYVEVAPLVEVDDDVLRGVKRGQRPAYAFVPEMERQRLVADLDRVMTVEKSIVADWERTPGTTTDGDARAFAQALARKRVRFAFPDDFNALAKKLQKRLSEKHEKSNAEGEALRSLREIRVLASPSWDAETVEVFFWFIRDDELETFDGTSWDKLLDAWLALAGAHGRYTRVDGAVVTLGDMTALDYVDSDPLDLDHLSNASP
jgi:hypothetical protein